MNRVFLIIVFVFILGQVLPAQEQNVQQNVAVINFEALGLSQVEGAALTDRFRSELFKTGKFTVLERDKMDEILVEQGLQQTGCTSSECLVEMGKLLNVHRIFAGSVSQFGNIFSVTVRLVDIQTGKIQDTNSQDFSSGKEKLLTEGMKAVALYFAGIKTVIAAPRVEQPVTTSSDTSALKREMLNKMSARRRSK